MVMLMVMLMAMLMAMLMVNRLLQTDFFSLKTSSESAETGLATTWSSTHVEKLVVASARLPSWVLLVSSWVAVVSSWLVVLVPSQDFPDCLQ